MAGRNRKHPDLGARWQVSDEGKRGRERKTETELKTEIEAEMNTVRETEKGWVGGREGLGFSV